MELGGTLTPLTSTFSQPYPQNPPSAAERRWEEHAPQRRSVWAQLGRAPLAFALEYLHNLAEGAAGSPPEAFGDLIESYADGGWRVDAAFLQSLAEVSAGADRAAVEGARLAVYRPWLETQALALQQAFGPNASHYTPGAIVVRSPAW